MYDFEPPTDAELDRFVDGETAADEERTLLARLDDTDDGWRRLALAFCEDRALRRELSATSESRPTVERPVDRPSSIPRPRPLPRWFAPTLVGVLALTVGLAAGFGWGRSGERIADDGVPALPGDDMELVEAERGARDSLELLVDDGFVVRRVEVPVVSTDEAKLEWMDTRRPVVPAEVRRAFEEAGLEVAEHRQFLRVPLDDEHDALVPVGQFRVQRLDYQ